MKLSFIIVNFKHDENTLSIVKDLESCRLPKGVKLEILVVNNGKSPTIEDNLKKYHNAVYLDSPGNIGFSGGNNIGFTYALKHGAEIITMINDDTIVKPDFIEKVVDSPIKDKDVGVVGGLIYFAKGFEFEKKYKESEMGKVIWYAGGEIDWNNVYAKHIGVNEVDKGQYDEVKDTDFVTGCLFITKAEVLKKAGILDDRYCLYFEDSDLGLRIKRQGYRLVFDPRIKIYHKVAQSSGIGSPLNDYFITRNRLLIGFSYASLRTKIALFREMIKMLIKTGTDAQKMAIRDFIFGRLGGGNWIPEAKAYRKYN